jgi:proton glutamate symport protein
MIAILKVFKLSLAAQMAIATCLGLICGIVFGDLCKVFIPYEQAYIMLLKITAVPYLIGAIMHGIGLLGLSQAKMILKKGAIFLSLAWLVNISMIYLTYGLFSKSRSNHLAGYIPGNVSPLNFAELLIPDNIFYDLANNIIPAIVIFSILIGIALMHLKEKQTLMQGIQNLVEALTRITGWIAKITPIGTFLIIADKAGTTQFDTVKQVSTYLILYILCLSIIVFWIFPRITSMLTHISPYYWLQSLSPILLLALTTNVVIVCLPYIIELIRKEIQAIDPFDEKAQTQIQGTVSVIFNLPMGSLFITIFVLFISLFYNAPLSLSNHIDLLLTTFLTSLGAVGIGSWINSLTFILDSLGLPQEATSLFLTTLPFTSGFQAMVSATQIASLSLLIILASRKYIKFNWQKISKNALVTLLPVLLLFALIKIINPLPEIKDDRKSIFELSIVSDVPTAIYTSINHRSSSSQEDAFFRILKTKTLRVGYAANMAPFSFYNTNKELVGYNITFAYALAADLGCKLEFVPMNYENVAAELRDGLYDIALSSLSITESRLKNIAFTQTYLEPEFVFVIKKSYKKRFTSLQSVRSNTALSIAVLKGTSYEQLARQLFPSHKIVPLDNPEQFALNCPADALFWTETEAIAWSLRNRQFQVIFPSPTIGKDSLAYATNLNSPQLVQYLNQWLQLKQVQGYSEKQYNLWILEKTDIIKNPPPRWSVLRYLGWVK